MSPGGTLDFESAGNYLLAEGHGSMQFTVEAGARVQLKRFFNGNNRNHTTRFIADADGVSPIEISQAAFINGGRLEIDLGQYDLSQGTELVLLTYGFYPPQSAGFKEVQLSEGWSGQIDYNYTSPNGQSAIAITQLHRQEDATVGIPEPQSYGLLLGCLSAACAWARRRGRRSGAGEATSKKNHKYPT